MDYNRPILKKAIRNVNERFFKKNPFPTEFALAEHAKQSKELIQAEYERLVKLESAKP